MTVPPLRTASLAKRGVNGVNVSTRVTTERLERLARLAADGKLKAPRIRMFPLEQGNEAFKLLGEGGAHGTIVVKI